MKQIYTIVDLNNLAMRVRFGTRAPDLDTQVGLAMHVIFSSIKKVWEDLNSTHVVFALEGRSWRRDFYPRYKANRRKLNASKTTTEQEEDAVFFDALNSLIDFLINKTNCTVLRSHNAEADDLIARWIDLHPNDDHVIVSTDSDFQQLLANNVKIYNGIAALLYTIDGVFDKDGNVATDSKGQPMGKPNPEWLLFEKIMRGDASDNVMSAFPGIRKKKLQEAFDNKQSQGYAWNNLMLSTWTDHDGTEIRVRDSYNRNKTLIDLRAQPRELIADWDAMINRNCNKAKLNQIGFHLLKFTNLWGLVRIEKNITEYSPCFSANYQGCLRQD